MASAVSEMGLDNPSSNETQTKPSPAAWSLLRETIIDLYTAKDLKLKDVKDIMAEQRSFIPRYAIYLALIYTKPLH